MNRNGPTNIQATAASPMRIRIASIAAPEIAFRRFSVGCFTGEGSLLASATTALHLTKGERPHSSPQRGDFMTTESMLAIIRVRHVLSWPMSSCLMAEQLWIDKKPFAGNHDKQGVVGLTARRRRLDHEAAASSVIRWLKCEYFSTHTSIE